LAKSDFCCELAKILATFNYCFNTLDYREMRLMLKKKETQEPEQIDGNLHMCPFCACCFCNEIDLKQHIENFGNIKSEHMEAFRKAHGRLEHGSYSG
jgi:hypothetical protein